MKALKFTWAIIALSLLFFVSCSEDPDDPEVKIEPRYLVETETISTIYTASLKQLLQTTGDANGIADQLNYDVELYSVVYKTYFEGDTIEASGVFACPVSSGKSFPMISYQHGTIFTKAEAPTVYLESQGYMTNQSNEALAAIVMASAGNIVVMADYIGFGESEEFFHPYMNVEYTNNAVLDMIRASKEFISVDAPCASNNKLFLLGYSQGGSATTGSLKAIETEAANSDIDVTAAVAGSGAYNLSEFRKYVMKPNSEYQKPSFILYIFESLKEYSPADIDYSLIFSEEYVEMVPGMIDGYTYSYVIDNELGTYMGRIFNDNFEDDETFNTSDDYAPLRVAFEANSVEGWDIETPLKLFYSNGDIWVPASQSSLFYASFPSTKQGSTVKLNPLTGLDHVGAFYPTILGALEWFEGQ
ncbi:MAG: prolyl oligopeptidase family serine peptidase [Prolixibacteraceae bacterium]|nr:prolyl oligopeptidase family serine peptidase [Prolixibacteraceae bacterium]MBN2650423.1 prolyl oligopeptidase family serine peptidase [Prolixibacteraceae bacterium]